MPGTSLGEGTFGEDNSHLQEESGLNAKLKIELRDNLAVYK